MVQLVMAHQLFDAQPRPLEATFPHHPPMARLHGPLVAILRLAQPAAGALTIGPTDAEDIVRRIVQQRRDATPDPFDDVLDEKGLPPFDQHVEHVWCELDARSREPDADL
jgi:hypothetical protein